MKKVDGKDSEICILTRQYFVGANVMLVSALSTQSTSSCAPGAQFT